MLLLVIDILSFLVLGLLIIPGIWNFLVDAVETLPFLPQ